MLIYFFTFILLKFKLHVLLLYEWFAKDQNKKLKPVLELCRFYSSCRTALISVLCLYRQAIIPPKCWFSHTRPHDVRRQKTQPTFSPTYSFNTRVGYSWFSSIYERESLNRGLQPEDQYRLLATAFCRTFPTKRELSQLHSRTLGRSVNDDSP